MEIRALHNLEGKATGHLSDLVSSGNEDGIGVANSSNFTEEEEEKEDKVITNLELQALIEKLHRFAKLQLAKLSHESGVVHDKINM